jgi:putative oxidoreductase
MIDAQAIVLLVARLLFALLFTNSAVDKFRLNPVELQQIASLRLPFPKTIERLTGMFEIVAALALVIGVYARVAAVALALFMAFISIMFLRFWSFDGPPDTKTMLRNFFFGNAAAIGGLLYVAAFGPGALAIIEV